MVFEEDRRSRIPGKKREREREKRKGRVISREVIKKLSVFSVFHLCRAANNFVHLFFHETDTIFPNLSIILYTHPTP